MNQSSTIGKGIGQIFIHEMPSTPASVSGTELRIRTISCVPRKLGKQITEFRIIIPIQSEIKPFVQISILTSYQSRKYDCSASTTSPTHYFVSVYFLSRVQYQALQLSSIP